MYVCMYIYIYIHTYYNFLNARYRHVCLIGSYGHRRGPMSSVRPISLLTMWISEGWTLNLKGWNFQVHRGFPGKCESSNVSRDNVSREIGRKTSGAPFKRESGRVSNQ